MNIFELVSMTLTLPMMIQFISVIFIGVLLVFLVKARKQTKQDIHDIVELRRDLRALTAAALGVGERVLKVERQQISEISEHNFKRNTSNVKSGKELGRNLSNHLSADTDKVVKFSHHNDSPYEHAIHLVQKGADVNDLVTTCGLSQGEADLVNLLHRISDIGTKKTSRT